ncbi:tRNA (mnm(5)s(2)U34)-methyltransferase [Conchiformibius kuhniae]|uniref:Class I SAM-dependent methyltransferase n=1 Tax=Conchiformibius kuhniae TaxID=211502 RepID=A0A8T9MYK1_9NEIS|nr:class I SAM-dependent methyltransferase [Conchiformibius kuhniae]
MTLQNVIPFAHALVQQHLHAGDYAVDGTMGNGHDTLMLAHCVGDAGRVFAFDIQSAALTATADRLHQAGLRHRAELIQTGHEHMTRHVPLGIRAAIFNFGYLPGGDKNITTRADTSLAAVGAALSLLADGGLLVAVLYPGHDAGKTEADLLNRYAKTLPFPAFNVLYYGFTNRAAYPPFLLAIEKNPTGAAQSISPI